MCKRTRGEQEVEAGEATPLEIVLAADFVTQRLKEEKDSLEQQQQEAFDAQAQARLKEIYADLAARDAGASEGLARRILLGLGFPHSWQVLTLPTPFNAFLLRSSTPIDAANAVLLRRSQ